jgi:hypothetical protein
MKDKVVMDFNDLEGQLSSDSDEDSYTGNMRAKDNFKEEFALMN